MMNAGPLTVLVVEDNAEMRAFLQKELSAHYRVRVASDGEEGWSKVKEAPPDLLLSDTRMPGMGGTRLCRCVKEADEVPSLPVILLSEEETEWKGHPFGPDAVLCKPFAMDDLRKRMEQYLPRRDLPDLDGVDGAGEFLKAVVRVIERRLHDPDFTTAELAETVSLSRRHLTRRLKAVADRTPAVLIRERRIERAKQRLEQGPKTIAEVGRAVGFRSPSHFSQVFREEAGRSPSVYREQHAS